MLCLGQELGTPPARRWLPFIVLLAVSGPGQGTEEPSKRSEKLKPIPVCSNLVAAANLDRIPLEGMSPLLLLSETNALHAGDSATLLVTFVQKAKQTQWLLYVEAAAPDPAKPAPKPSKFVVQSKFGPPMKFKSQPVPVTLRMLGPFAAAGVTKPLRPEDRTEKFLLNEGFLALGLDQAAALLDRWGQTTNFDKAATSEALLAMKPTEAEQRALCATFPALFSYFTIVQHTEGLESLLRKLIDLPSLWSIIRHGGVKADFSFGNGVSPSPADPANWNLPAAAPVYHFPWLLRLNDEPALKITLIVTRPQSPFLICGGVVGALAEKIGDDQIYMTFRVISARRQAGDGDLPLP
jgi:hypothetical protein